ncbi:hypothetical protein ACIG3E_32680 [Streptomyces sp. NPDC053474]|uniref:hypothetical protein n=1 Tax=Streptomyces sp. NPDC053474 TaxID=3365704 RepID=UPI0037D57D86
MLGHLRDSLTEVTRHRGFRDVDGTPATAAEAWAHYDAPRRDGSRRAVLRELDARTGVYELRVNGQLRYEMRTPGESASRIDVVADRDPDGSTSISVYLDGARVAHPGVHVHVVDPGGDGADHEWLTGQLRSDACVPVEVRAHITALAKHYHRRTCCPHSSCDG